MVVKKASTVCCSTMPLAGLFAADEEVCSIGDGVPFVPATSSYAMADRDGKLDDMSFSMASSSILPQKAELRMNQANNVTVHNLLVADYLVPTRRSNSYQPIHEADFTFVFSKARKPTPK